MALRPWTLPQVAAGVVTDFVVPTPTLEVAVIGLIVCNHGAPDAADVAVTLTDNSGAIKSTVFIGTLDPGESVHIDTKVCLAASPTPDKLRALSRAAAVSFLASGDEG
jgi:hypothetical protein